MGLRNVIVTGGLATFVVAGVVLGDTGSSGREIPEAFAPFEYLVGSWNGTGVPSANKLKGWNEKHAWAWKFDKGTAVGLSVTMTGDKLLAKGRLSFDADAKRFKLEGNDPEGKSVAFVGAVDKSGKNLVLDRVGSTGDKLKQRLTIVLNSNLVRYTVWVDQQEPGAPQFKRMVVVGLTKEGEAFAAGASASDLPKCIVTGGTASLSVTYQGKSYPLCCTGCRDEFNESPEKYVKKAAALAASAGKPSGKTTPSRVSRDDGSFDGLADEPKAAEAKPK